VKHINKLELNLPTKAIQGTAKSEQPNNKQKKLLCRKKLTEDSGGMCERAGGVGRGRGEETPHKNPEKGFYVQDNRGQKHPRKGGGWREVKSGGWEKKSLGKLRGAGRQGPARSVHACVAWKKNRIKRGAGTKPVSKNRKEGQNR